MTDIAVAVGVLEPDSDVPTLSETARMLPVAVLMVIGVWAYLSLMLLSFGGVS